LFLLISLKVYSLEHYTIHEAKLNKKIDFLNVSGDHYGVGLAIGKTFASKIIEYVKNDDDLQDLFIPYYNTSDGRKVIDLFEKNNRLKFPQYFDEIMGMADGSGVPYYLLLLMNLEDELGTILDAIRHDHCTDVFLNNRVNQHVLGHNEDDDFENCKLSFFLVATFYSSHSWRDLQLGNKVTNEGTISSYVNPGFLLGCTYGFNSYGLVFSANELGSNDITIGGYANYFITRSAYDARTFDQIKSAISVDGRSLGFSLNVGDLRTRKLYNIEFTNKVTDILEIVGNYSHENLYRHIKCDEDTDESSDHRLERINQLNDYQSLRDIATVLSDNYDKEYPIYRDGKLPDGYYTCSTMLYDLDNKIARVYSNNPRQNYDNPYFSFNLN